MTEEDSGFTELVDLVSERVGGAALFTNDEFFAPKENLVKASEPVFLEHEYTERGKLMDGWESRRKRVPGHDHCILRLGLPGTIQGFVVDTTHFRGNYPESCSIEMTSAPGHAPLEALTAPETEWLEILPRTPLRGNSKNYLRVRAPHVATHLRLNIFPDGGVARLRAFGEPAFDWPRIARYGGEVDVAAVENGGLVLAVSDRFFSSPHNLLMPGRGTYMGDGWETRRRRGPGHDHAIVKLGLCGIIHRVEVDTAHFKGNYPDACSLEACDAEGASLVSLGDGSVRWTELLPRTKLMAHTRHVFEREVCPIGQVTHVRFNIYPDGGVSRLRLFATLSPEARRRHGIAWLDRLTPADARAALLACLGSSAWAARMERERPFRDLARLMESADAAAAALESADWLEAFGRHPKIGERRERERWSSEEQAGARAIGEETRAALEEGNRAYLERFGFIFIVCATGRSAGEMLAILRERLGHERSAELAIAAEEQRKITRLRLEKLIGGT